jgi:hypothetical protein
MGICPEIDNGATGRMDDVIDLRGRHVAGQAGPRFDIPAPERLQDRIAILPEQIGSDVEKKIEHLHLPVRSTIRHAQVNHYSTLFAPGIFRSPIVTPQLIANVPKNTISALAIAPSAVASSRAYCSQSTAM